MKVDPKYWDKKGEKRKKKKRKRERSFAIMFLNKNITCFLLVDWLIQQMFYFILRINKCIFSNKLIRPLYIGAIIPTYQIS